MLSERQKAEILFTNERFYAAFSGGDMTSMDSLWGSEGPVYCLHPGWEPLMERNQIIASWNAVLQAPPPIFCAAPSILPLGEDGAAVVCWEGIDEDYLIATNLYRRESGMWKIVHHQAGPVHGTPPTSSKSPQTSRVN